MGSTTTRSDVAEAAWARPRTSQHAGIPRSYGPEPQTTAKGHPGGGRRESAFHRPGAPASHAPQMAAALPQSDPLRPWSRHSRGGEVLGVDTEPFHLDALLRRSRGGLLTCSGRAGKTLQPDS